MRRRRALVALLLVLPLLAVAVWAARSSDPASQAVRWLGPGDRLDRALELARPGTTLELRPGTYPAQRWEGLALQGVTLRGTDRAGVVVAGLSLHGVSGLTVASMTVVNAVDSSESAVRVSDGSHDLDFRDLTIAPHVLSAFDVQAGTSRITLEDSRLVGTGVTGPRALDSTSRGVRINAAPYDLAGWPSGITVRDNDISGFASDLMQIVGARDVLVEGNDLHDPQFTPDHNDGVQSVASDGLVIRGNRFSAPGPNGPDQAIILGQPGTDLRLKVTDTTIEDNLVLAWRGTGINLAGSARTTIDHNTVARTGTDFSPGSSLGLHGQNAGATISDNVLDKLFDDGTSRPALVDNCIRTGGRGPGLVTADPQITDFTTLALSADSPCLGRGRR